MNLSISRMYSSGVDSGIDDKSAKTSVIWSKTFHAFYVVRLPLLEKKEAVLQPVSACSAQHAWTFGGHNWAAISWIARYLKCFPVLKAVHTSSASISVILETAGTTSVLMVLIMIFLGMGHVQYEVHAIFFMGTFFHTIPSSAQLK